MMYDHEKATPAIAAGKPRNKAGQPPAKLVEPRAGTEGNVRQQSTGRAQYRGTVSQALERIRQAARQRKKEKFTALFHHVSIDYLEEAFSELKENAAPGVDGLTCRDPVRSVVTKASRNTSRPCANSPRSTNNFPSRKWPAASKNCAFKRVAASIKRAISRSAVAKSPIIVAT